MLNCFHLNRNSINLKIGFQFGGDRAASLRLKFDDLKIKAFH